MLAHPFESGSEEVASFAGAGELQRSTMRGLAGCGLAEVEALCAAEPRPTVLDVPLRGPRFLAGLPEACNTAYTYAAAPHTTPLMT